MLDQYGWSGPTTAIEGKRGFCVAFAPEYDIEAITRDLGKDYCILKSSLKRYCCNANIGPAIDALQAILAETPIGAEDIEEIEVRHSTNAGRAIVAIGPEPPDRVGAQFSIHFSLALAVVKGKNDFNTLMTVDLKDPQVVNMAKRVRPVADKEADAEDRKGHNWAGVTVVTKDGRRFSKAQLASGSAENPLSQGEVESKFRELASTVLEHDKVEELIGLCGHLEDVADSSRVVKCLATVDITKQPKIHHA